MIATQIDNNLLQKGGAAEEGGNLMALPEQVPIEQLAPPVPTEMPPLSFANSILDANVLDKMDIPKREPLVGSWWRAGSFGFIFGERGKGKSWIGLSLACCLAAGRDCGPWSIPKARRVLYVDGEMPLDAIKERSGALAQTPTDNLRFLSHQHHFDQGGGLLNLTDPAAQRALLEVCERDAIEVLILDNLSCLFYGMEENNADHWERVLPCLLDMRRMGISVCIVHHARRGGANMRGTSKREDAAFWIIQVTSADDEEPPEIGYRLKFITEFTKYRDGGGEDAGPWEWIFEPPAEGAATTVRWGLLSKLNLFMRLIEENGFESCSEIAEEMGLSKGTVSKLAKRAKAQKLIAIEGSGNQGRYTSIRMPLLS